MLDARYGWRTGQLRIRFNFTARPSPANLRGRSACVLAFRNFREVSLIHSGEDEFVEAYGATDRVVIIGCGYVGTALGSALVGRGCHVVGTTTTPGRSAAIAELGIVPVVVKHSEKKRLHAIVRECDAVVLAISPGRSGADYRDVYVAGATNLVAALADTPVRRLIYTSSTGVYAQQDGSWVDELSPTEPTTENGRALLQAEQILLNAPNDVGIDQSINVSVVRLSGIYGPGREIASRVRALAGQKRLAGGAFVNLIHQDDIVSAIGLLLPCDHHGVLTLSDDQPIKRRKLYDEITARLDLSPICWLDDDGAKLGKRVRNRRIKQLLNLSLKHPRFEIA